MSESSRYKKYYQVYDREFDLEEIIRGLLGLDLSPGLREACINEAKTGGGDKWYVLNEEHGGSATERRIPSRAELWKALDRGEDIENYLPSSKGKRNRECNLQFALWGGILEELDATGLVYDFGYDAVKEVATRLGLKIEEYIVPPELSPTGQPFRSMKIRP